MKKLFYLIVLFLFLGLGAFSQEINQLNNGTSVSRGKLTLKDGKVVGFKNLKLYNGLFTFSDGLGNIINQKSSDVYKVTKKGNYFLLGALSGGIGALIGSQQGINEAKTTGVKSTVDESSLTMTLTLGGVVVGGLIGLAMPREKLVFKNTSALSFYPSFNYTPDGKYYPTLSLKINLN
jgi:hypothetical protein